jgi:site-specific DNA-methyltransferase (adenine-specific)
MPNETVNGGGCIMKGTEPLFSHKKDDWITPQKFFDKLDEEFHFKLDAAASPDNGKCPHNLTENALSEDWHMYKNIWLNPPYSQIKEFIGKAYHESLKGCNVACLIPSRTDTQYWHDYVMKAKEIRFIKGRLRFGDGKGSAPFPSCIVIFNGITGSPKITTMERPS